MKKNMKKLLWLFLAITIINMLLISKSPIAYANSTELAVINPSTGGTTFVFNAPTTNVGDTFIANVTVFNVANLSSWQLNVTWDPSVINLVNVSLPPDHVFAGRDYYVVDPWINNTVGWVVLSVLLAPAQPPFWGDGTLYQLEFNITKAPDAEEIISCDIGFELDPEYWNTYLLDPAVNEIPFTPKEGSYNFLGENVPLVTLKIVPSTLEVGEVGVEPPTDPFVVNVTVEDVENLHAWQIKVLFNSTILNCTNATLPEDNVFADWTIVESTPIINNTAGYVIYNATIEETVGFNGSGILCQLEFIGIDLGTTDLKFSTPYGEETFLKTPTGGLILIIDAYMQKGIITVIPEFPAIAVALILVATTFIAVVIKKKLPKNLH